MGLKRIVLRDFVIVSQLDLELAEGFSVLTGETGAGKSILIDALQLVTGARADTGLIREGASRTEVSAEFDPCPALASWLEEGGFASDETLLLRRVVDAQGKSRAWINGSPATAAQLRAVGEQLFDIHGQHAWQSLTRGDAVRGLLDAYAQADTQALARLWQAWRLALGELAQAQTAQETLQREHERLSWQIGELDKLAPRAGEWEELNSEHSRLSHAQALLDAAQGAIDLLDEAEDNTGDLLGKTLTMLQAQAHLEPEFANIAEVLASSLAQVEDSAHSLRAYLRRTEPDPLRLAELDTRVSQWLALARRYKRPPHELAALLAGWKEDLAKLEAAADLAALSEAEARAEAAYLQEARALSRLRASCGAALARSVSQAMQGLGMQGGRFEVALEKLATPQQSGLEDVQFLVAAHAGSTPRAVGKVASGGELSRIALAIAVTTSRLGNAQTLIFDEVDAGVGGAVAETVGRLMKQLGRDRQVLAVTHLPQVAACADHHLLVSKLQQDGTTLSSVSAVQGEQRVSEIARMLGGEKLSGTSLAHAREMLLPKE
ncbi:MAG: putative repair ATPase [Pseudomonadota bacterium]